MLLTVVPPALRRHGRPVYGRSWHCLSAGGPPFSRPQRDRPGGRGRPRRPVDRSRRSAHRGARVEPCPAGGRGQSARHPGGAGSPPRGFVRAASDAWLGSTASRLSPGRLRFCGPEEGLRTILGVGERKRESASPGSPGRGRSSWVELARRVYYGAHGSGKPRNTPRTPVRHHGAL